DDRVGTSEPVAILEYHYWQSAYGGQRDVIGKTIPLDGRPFTIVGVSERGFFGPSVGRRFDVAVSLAGYQFLYPGSNRPTANFLTIIGRLRDGQSIDAAQAAARARQPQIRVALGQSEKVAQLMQPWEIVPMRAGMTTVAQERYQAPLRVLMALVALVLVIACVNVANLLLAKATARRGELAMKLSLGASRIQVMRSTLIESLLLAATGAAGGLLVGIWSARAIVNAIAVNQSGALATWIEVPIDVRMLAFTTAVGVGTALIFGIGPAIRATGVAPLEAMRQRDRGAIGGGARIGVSQVLVAGQVAIAFVLVFGGGLLIRSFIAATTQDLGFDERSVTVAVPDFSRSTIPRQQRVPTAERVRAQLVTMAGVDGVGLAESAPFGLGSAAIPFVVPGGLHTNEDTVVLNRVSDGFFGMIGTPLRAGRDFGPLAGEPPTSAIVNEAFADRYFAGLNPLGQTLQLRLVNRTHVQIVGVVGNARSGSLRDPVAPTLFLPFRLNDEPWIEINIRSRNGAAVKDAVLRAFSQTAPDVSVEFRSIEAGIAYAAARDRVVAWLAGGFAVLALLLSAIGLYGIMSHQMIRRRQEFGVRIAIGAQPSSVTNLILKQATFIIAAGLVIGLAAALASAQLISALLYGVTPTDPVTMASTAIFLSLVAMAAALIPARRAARVDPMIALRDE
ncbi:MAG TPA: FtsX-like permease family protein, partial [Vicinamibacterales bacterium]